jgi:hypothetical protein
MPNAVLCRAVGLQFGLQSARQPMSAFESKADIPDRLADVR